MDRIGVFTRDFQILYLFETRETLEFVLNNSFEGSLYTRRRWWFCCYLYKWYNLWCKTLSNKQSAACYSRFHHTKTRNISKTPVGARWCNFKRLLGTISKLLSSHSKNFPYKVGCVFPMRLPVRRLPVRNSNEMTIGKTHPTLRPDIFLGGSFKILPMCGKLFEM